MKWAISSMWSVAFTSNSGCSMFSASESSRNAWRTFSVYSCTRHAIARGVADDLVVHVRDVHDVLQLVAALLQETPQGVDHDECAEIADVPVVVNRRPASVHADQVVFQRVELFDLAGQGIEKLKRHCEVSCRLNL